MDVLSLLPWAPSPFGCNKTLPSCLIRIGYQLSGNCDWEEDHGIEIEILDGKLVYLSEYSGGSSWVDHSEKSWNSAPHLYE